MPGISKDTLGTEWPKIDDVISSFNKKLNEILSGFLLKFEGAETADCSEQNMIYLLPDISTDPLGTE